MTKPHPSSILKFLRKPEAIQEVVLKHDDSEAKEKATLEQGRVIGYAEAFDDLTGSCKGMTNFGLLQIEPVVIKMATKLRGMMQ